MLYKGELWFRLLRAPLSLRYFAALRTKPFASGSQSTVYLFSAMKKKGFYLVNAN
jgi:hypothetical protein